MSEHKIMRVLKLQESTVTQKIAGMDIDGVD